MTNHTKKAITFEVIYLIIMVVFMVYGVYCLYYWYQNPEMTQMEVFRWAIGLD